MKKGFDSNFFQYPLPGPSSEDASPIETQQNKDVPGSSATNFQHSEEHSGTQALDACKLSMVVDLADVLSDIKPRK